jgi:hypothetical protein
VGCPPFARLATFWLAHNTRWDAQKCAATQRLQRRGCNVGVSNVSMARAECQYIVEVDCQLKAYSNTHKAGWFKAGSLKSTCSVLLSDSLTQGAGVTHTGGRQLRRTPSLGLAHDSAHDRCAPADPRRICFQLSYWGRWQRRRAVLVAPRSCAARIGRSVLDRKILGLDRIRT